MSSTPPPQVPIPWWQSPTLRLAAVAAAPMLTLGIKALMHVNVSQTDAVEMVMSGCACLAVLGIVWRRVVKGLDPKDSDPPIKMSVL